MEQMEFSFCINIKDDSYDNNLYNENNTFFNHYYSKDNSSDLFVKTYRR